MTAKIGFLTYALERKASGIGQYTLRLLSGLRQMGCTPMVLQSGGWPPGFTADGFPVLRLRGSGLLPALMLWGQAQIGWQARRHQLDLVHDPTGAFPLSLCQCKRVVTICDAIPYVYPEVSMALDRLIYRYWLPAHVKQMDAVLTISQQSRLDLQKHLMIPGRKIMVTPLAAGPKFRLLTDEEMAPALVRAGVERPYILYVGSVEPRKNLLRLLEAYRLLRAWSTRWRLVIVGARNYWKSSPVARKVQELGLQDQVLFTGYIPDADLPALYNGADLFCFPSLYEGFGLPVLEAMACGTPVVTSDSSSLPEVAGDAALLVDPHNVDEIAAAMRRILDDPDLATDLRKRGLLRASQFSWERTARETIEIYYKVLGDEI